MSWHPTALNVSFLTLAGLGAVSCRPDRPGRPRDPRHPAGRRAGGRPPRRRGGAAHRSPGVRRPAVRGRARHRHTHAPGRRAGAARGAAGAAAAARASRARPPSRVLHAAGGRGDPLGDGAPVRGTSAPAAWPVRTCASGDRWDSRRPRHAIARRKRWPSIPIWSRYAICPGRCARRPSSETTCRRRRARASSPGDIRPFAPGDHVRHVNWRATLRLDTLHVTQHHRERNADVVLLLDTLSDVGRDGGHGRRRRRAGGGHAGAALSGPEGSRRSDRVRRPASLGAARLRPRTAPAPARHAPGRLGRLHVRDARRRPRPPARSCRPRRWSSRSARCSTRASCGPRATSRPALRPRGHRGLAGGGGPRGRPPEPGRRRGRAALGPGAPRAARGAPPRRADHLDWDGVRTARCGPGLAAAAASTARARGMIRLAAAALVTVLVGIPLAILPAAPVTWLRWSRSHRHHRRARPVGRAGDGRRIARADRVRRRTRAGQAGGRSHGLRRPRHHARAPAGARPLRPPHR